LALRAQRGVDSSQRIERRRSRPWGPSSAATSGSSCLTGPSRYFQLALSHADGVDAPSTFCIVPRYPSEANTRG
jgi:hypothetical protein